jgi:hypothetical protein
MPEDMFTMQQEAVRRAREMHSRATNLHRDSHQSNETEQNPQQHQPPQSSQQNHTAPATAPAPVAQAAPQDWLSNFFKDKDRTIILALLLLLSGDNGDNSLLFALMYLLM